MKFPVLFVSFLPADGMSLFPFILVKDRKYKNDAAFVNHERIHLSQQLELLVLGFYIAYLINYLINRFKYKTHDEAYRNIVFEKEAYLMEADLGYLKRRKLWGWLKFRKATYPD